MKVNDFENGQIANFLADYIDGVAPLDTLLAYYDISCEQVADLIAIADQLGDVLVDVSPSPTFILQLYEDLLQENYPAQSWWEWMQAFPTRMKLAAGFGGLTITAGVLYVTMRSLGLGHLLPEVPFLRIGNGQESSDLGDMAVADTQPAVEIAA